MLFVDLYLFYDSFTCRRESYKKMDGSRDGSRKTAKTELFVTLGDTGSQESRRNGMDAKTFLVSIRMIPLSLHITADTLMRWGFPWLWKIGTACSVSYVGVSAVLVTFSIKLYFLFFSFWEGSNWFGCEGGG